MALTSLDIQNQSFAIDRKGYDVDEVDDFLERVAAELDAMNAEIDSLRERAEAPAASETVVMPAASAPSEDAGSNFLHEAQLREKDDRIAELEKQLKEHQTNDAAVAQALIIAQRAGDEIIANSKADAEVTREQAEEEAQRILDKANNEKQRIIDHIEELQGDREVARNEYQDMLKDFITSSTKRLSEIGGDAAFAPSSLTASAATAAPKFTSSSRVATYTTPTVSPRVATPTAPKPSQTEKDLSGFGDADDDFEFDEID